MKLLKIYKVGLIVGVFFGITACDDSSSSSEVPPVALVPIKNKLDKRIYLKDLTTGDSIYKKGFPNYKNIADQFLLIDYSYFGSSRSFSVYTNADKRVVKYSFYFEDDASAMMSAIEEKFGIENKKEIKFDCLVSPLSVGEIKFNKKYVRLLAEIKRLPLLKKYC